MANREIDMRWLLILSIILNAYLFYDRYSGYIEMREKFLHCEWIKSSIIASIGVCQVEKEKCLKRCPQ